MNRKPFIALVGKAQHGKSTLASAIVENLDGYERASFAAPVREFALALDPYIVHHYDPLDARYSPPEVERLSALVDRLGWEEAKTIGEVRRTLQRIGTEAGRGVLGEDVWVRKAIDAAYEADYRGKSVVFDDCRFDNEAEAVRVEGGIVIRVVRDDNAPVLFSEHASHPSEAGVSASLVDVQITWTTGSDWLPGALDIVRGLLDVADLTSAKYWEYL